MIRLALVLSVALAPCIAMAGTHPTPVQARDPVQATLQAALARAERADAVGGSPIPVGATLRPSGVDARVPLLRERLDTFGIAAPAGDATPVAIVAVVDADVPSDDDGVVVAEGPAVPVDDLVGPVAPATLVYDDALTRRIRVLQTRWGLKDDGVVGRRTLRALNFTPADEARALRQTLARYQPPPAHGKSIVVNVPTAEIIAFENGVEVMRTRAVVGSMQTQTPLIESNMTAVKYNPDWTVPPGLTKKYKGLMAAGRSDEVRKHGVVVRTPDGQTYDVSQVPADMVGSGGWRFWQPPGDANALGLLKFELDNDQAIYLHDTNNRRLFATDNRAVSNGCIRVEDYLGLAAWVLGIDIPSVEQAIATGRTHFARVPGRIPVRMTYYMAYPDKLGGIRYGEDVYGLAAETAEVPRPPRPRARL